MHYNWNVLIGNYAVVRLTQLWFNVYLDQLRGIASCFSRTGYHTHILKTKQVFIEKFAASSNLAQPSTIRGRNCFINNLKHHRHIIETYIIIKFKDQ